MVRNFIREVAPELINREPGHTAEYYAERALNERLSESNADSPIFSLSSTLAKTVREGRLDSVRRERIDGSFLYFPASAKEVFTMPIGSKFHASFEPAVTVRVSESGSPLGSNTSIGDELAEILDIMSRLSISRSKAEALVDLATRWLNENNQLVSELKSNADAINSMRDQIRGRKLPE